MCFKLNPCHETYRKVVISSEPPELLIFKSDRLLDQTILKRICKGKNIKNEEGIIKLEIEEGVVQGFFCESKK